MADMGIGVARCECGEMWKGGERCGEVWENVGGVGK